MALLDAKDILDLVATEWGISPTIYKENIDSGSYGIIPNGSSIVKTFSEPILKSIMHLFTLHYVGTSCNFVVKFLYEGELSDTTIVTITGSHTDTLLDLYSLMDVTKKLSVFTITGLTGNNADISLVTLLTTNGEIKLVLDEYDPRNPLYQIVFINRPERTVFVSPNVIKHEQNVNVEVHAKLVRYDPTEVTNKRATFKNIKGELSRIFNTYRYDNVGSTINVSAWLDAKLPHGFGIDAEPLQLVTRLTMQIFYYESIDNTNIGVRVSEVEILGADLLGLIDVHWIDTNPWVHLQIPKGPLLEQHLLGPHLDGEISTYDYASLHTRLYETPIVSGGIQYPILVDGTKIKFSTDIPTTPQLIIKMVDDEGNIYTYNFFDVRIKQVELVNTNTTGQNEAVWKVTFMADFCYYVAPS